MGNKYIINHKNYSNSTWGSGYQSEWFIPALVVLIYCKFKYDVVDLSIRN